MNKKGIGPYGQGIGGPVQITKDPDNPSFDVASHESDTDRRIREILKHHQENLTAWELDLLTNCYGKAPLTEKQHIGIWKIEQSYSTSLDRS